MGKWKRMYLLLYPHPLLVILASIISCGGLVWVFTTGRDFSIIAYCIYGFSAYSLLTLTLLLIKWVPKIKEKTKSDPVYQLLRRSEDGAFDVGTYVEQFINFCYGAWKITNGIIVGSAWIGADGIYNFVQSLIQLYQILRHKKAESVRQQWKTYKKCGFLVLVLHLTMTGMVFQMIHMGRHEQSTEIMIIATAAYTFWKLIKAIAAVIKDRKHKNPVDSAVYYLNLSQALYNLFVLQVGLLWIYGGEDFPYQKLMNTCTGGAVCMLVCGMGIYMIWRGNRDIQKAPLI